MDYNLQKAKMTNEVESQKKQFSNWLQSVQALEETKKALHDNSLLCLKNELLTWEKDVRASIPTFLECVVKDNINHKRKKWVCECTHPFCSIILNRLLSIQQNPGFSIVWNSKLCSEITKKGYTFKCSSNKPDISSIRNTESTTGLWPFLKELFEQFLGWPRSEEKDNEKADYENVFSGCKEEHIWSIANMFMQRGKAKLNIKNTGPDDTDASMFFRMMKNCKCFEIKDENHLYDDILLCRDKLHHSANNSITREEAESHMRTMVALLQKFKKVSGCTDAIAKIEKMREETVLCISVPDIHIREMARVVFKLKRSALETDLEVIKDKGWDDNDIADLLQETIYELENINDPEKPLTEFKSRSEYKQEMRAIQSENEELKKKLSTLVEKENKQLKFKTEGIPGSVDKEVKVKNPVKHFELMVKCIHNNLDNPRIVNSVVTLVNPALDEVVESESTVNPSFRNKAEEYLNEEGIESERLQQPPAWDVDRPTQEKTASHVWTIEGRKTFNIAAADDKFRCYVTGCCQLPSGEILLADNSNRRLKKIDNMYKVIGVCDLPDEPSDVCYIGNNEAIVSLKRKLQFVNVIEMKLTKSEEQVHECLGLCCHGDQLYVTGQDSVFLYSIEGIQKRVLFTARRNDFIILRVVVSDDGSKVYILNHTSLITLDSEGNRLSTFTNEELINAYGICVDSEGNVLLCGSDSVQILQISADGEHTLGTLSDKSAGIGSHRTIFFDRHRSVLLYAGMSYYLTILELK